MLQAVRASAQLMVEQMPMTGALPVEDAAGDPLQPALVLDVAARAALERLAQAIGNFPPGERMHPDWALALARLQQVGRSLTAGQFGALCVMGSNQSWCLRRLTKSGMVAVGSSESDRRLTVVWLTEAGALWLARLRAELGR